MKGAMPISHTGLAPGYCHRTRRAGSAPSPEAVSQWLRWTGSATTQTRILGLGLAHPTSCPISDLLECGKGPVLQKDNRRISATRVTTGYLRGASMRVQWWSCTRNQRPWTTPMTHFNEHFAGGVDWTEGVPSWHTAAPEATGMNEEVLERWMSEVCFCCCSFCFVFN